MILSDRTAPVISGTSVGNPIAIDENVAQDSLVATMIDDGTAVSYAIVPGSNTNGDFAIANNGDITVVNPPNYEATPSYNLEITATDALGNTSAPFTVTININDLDEIAPVVTLVSQTYNAVFETDNNLTIASFTATDNGNDVTSSLTLSGTPNATNFALSYNSSTQQMDLVTASSGLLGGGVTADQTFTLTASVTDAAGNTGSQQITVVVKNAELPTISGSSSFSVTEGNTFVGTFTATGTPNISFSVSGTDANKFIINSSGSLYFSPAPDYENPTDSGGNRVYDINVSATNQFGSDTISNITVTVTDGYDIRVGGSNYNLSSSNPIILNGSSGSQTGSLLTVTVPTTRSVTFYMWGAAGGAGENDIGGAGGRAIGTVTLQAGQSYRLLIGGGGTRGSTGYSPRGGYGGGGGGGGSTTVDGSDGTAFGAGGNAGSGSNDGGGGGGGLTGLFLGSSASQGSAILIAGGGGGGSESGQGGAGGGSSGQAGQSGPTNADGGSGGTQSGPGAGQGSPAAGRGGGGDADEDVGGGGGGGGYYGGGGGEAYKTSTVAYSGGGGGGSGYIGSGVSNASNTAGSYQNPPQGTHWGNNAGVGGGGNGNGGRVVIVP